MNKPETFEALLEECKSAVERTVHFRISSRADAEDVLQEVYLTAYRRFETLTDQLSFKAWIISIARNKCVDYYRMRAARAELPMETMAERIITYGRCGPREEVVVRETLEQLADRDQNILRLYYFQELSQKEIAKKLDVPLGTVKSRLYTARQNFKERYPYPPGADIMRQETGLKDKSCGRQLPAEGCMQTNTSEVSGSYHMNPELQKKFPENPRSTGADRKAVKEGKLRKLVRVPAFGTEKEKIMSMNERNAAVKKGEALKSTVLPEFLPEYTIVKSEEAPFEVVWEELQGWMIIPRLGESLTWGLYELPSRKRTEYTELEVTGRAEVHGIEGVEIIAVQYNAEDYYRTGSVNEMERRFVAQLTDTHSRYLAESHVENGVRKCYTFLDGESFLKNWGFGEENCGNETHVVPKGALHKEGNCVIVNKDKATLDVVGRYTVTIAGKCYDTICVMDVESFDDAIATESYIDKNGRTVLWRRFNRDDWAIEHFGGKKWSETLPENERLMIGGSVYVHWYDCISNYIG